MKKQINIKNEQKEKIKETKKKREDEKKQEETKTITKEEIKKPEKRNRIEEYFTKTEKESKGNELFRVSPDNVDIKTELTEEEIRQVNTLHFNDIFLESKGLSPVFYKYFEKFMRLKISLERKGRTEFVKVNSEDRTDQFLETAGGLNNILQAKK